jgi:hypothetical protein
MTFSCPHYDLNAEGCRKLRLECIPTRPGCVLKGKIEVSPDIERRLEEAGIRRKAKGVRHKRKV